MPSGEDIEYTVAIGEDREAVRRALVAYFFPEEPLSIAYRHGREVAADDLENCLTFIDNGTVVLARLRSPERQVVGVAIGGPLDAQLIVPISTRKLADIMGILHQLEERSSELRLGLNCYNVQYLAVSPKYRGLSIGKRLVEQQIALARKLAIYDAVITDATGPFSVQLFKRAGMREIGRLRFDEYRDDQNEQVFNSSTGGEIITLMLNL